MMQSSSRCAGVTGIPPQLSTRTSLLSTRYAHALQVRDLVFVKRTRRTSYLGTGVDSRVDLASAPAMMATVEFTPPTLHAAPATHTRPATHAPQPAFRAITV